MGKLNDEQLKEYKTASEERRWEHYKHRAICERLFEHIDALNAELEIAESLLKGNCKACKCYKNNQCEPNNDLNSKEHFCMSGEKWQWRGIKD